jgi:hypothetical protein
MFVSGERAEARERGPPSRDAERRQMESALW